MVLGGDGSFKGMQVLSDESEGISFAGIPATIDNDIAGTEYCFGGYDRTARGRSIGSASGLGQMSSYRDINQNSMPTHGCVEWLLSRPPRLSIEE